MEILAGLIVAAAALVGVALTVLTLPGIWFILLVAVACELWQPGLFSWWTLGAAFILAIAAELTELLASAVGASRAGGTRRGALGAIIGATVGAIAGTPFFPVLGTLIGGSLGAAAGAVIAERSNAASPMPWRTTLGVGRGAAVGRFIATILKTAFAIAVALLLTIAAFIP